MTAAPRGGAGRAWRFRAIGHAAAAGALAGLVLVATTAAPAAGATPRRAPASRPERVLVLSLPGLAWSQVQSPAMPHLRRLLAVSSTGALIARTGRGYGPLADGYVTLGAGARAVGDIASGGSAFAPDEPVGATTAGAAFAVRTGEHVDTGLVHLGIARILAANASLLYDAKPGALADALVGAGYRPAVIGNADRPEADSTATGDGHDRAAAAAFMRADGTVPAGTVGPQLLTTDASAPYGEVLDPRAYERAFTAVWRPRAVVLAEASDLVRAAEYRPNVVPSQRPGVEQRALASTDSLVGSLLARVDLGRDAVIVVSPRRPTGGSLAVVAVHAPGDANAYLRSATTRRAHYAALVDVAPTILQLLGIEAPSSMEGRPMEEVGNAGPVDARIGALVDAGRDSLFRDSLIRDVTRALVFTTLGLVLAALVFRAPRYARVRRVLPWIALLALGSTVSVFASVPMRFAAHGGRVAFWCFVLGAAAVLALLYRFAGRRGPADPLLLALGAVVVLHVVDALTGAHLELDAPWGYSPTIGIRLAGIGNLSFAQLAAAAAVLAALLAWRIPGRAGVRAAWITLLVTFVALTPPLWGQNFGGTLAAAPAFALEGWLLSGRRLRLRGLLALGAVLVAAGMAVGLLDVLRPSTQQTHVGRFFQQVHDRGFAGLTMVLQRKGSENLSTLNDGVWALLLVGVAALVTWYCLRTDGVRRILTAVPTLRAASAALSVLVVLGYGLKDSGIAVPGMMVCIAALSGVYLDATFAGPADAPEPAPTSTGELLLGLSPAAGQDGATT